MEPLRIDAVQLRELHVPLVSPFETSGWREDEKSCIIVEIKSNHQSGFGECAVTTGPWYGPETITSAWQIMQDYFVPTVLGKTFTSPSQLVESIEFVRGNNMAKAGFEMAFYDLMAKHQDMPLFELLGGTKSRI